MAVFPISFETRIKSLIGTEAPLLLAALQKESPISVRYNPFKGGLQANESLQPTEPIKWCHEAVYLKERPSFTFDPLFHAGVYYVQEASSMFIAEAIRQNCDLTQPVKVIDLCAAPGGKSTLVASLINEDSLLIANEVIAARASILTENLMKWGIPNVIVTNNDPAAFSALQGCFDIVLVDAPCSGEGMFRKDENAITEWSEEHVKLCSARQNRVLQEARNLVKPNGILIYTTCTFSEEENELHFSAFSSDFKSVRLRLNETWGIEETKKVDSYGYRFYPHKVKGEGFFLSCFKRFENATEGQWPVLKKAIERPTKKQQENMAAWLECSAAYEGHFWNEQVMLLPKNLAQEMLGLLAAKLKIRMMGVEAGVFHRDEFSPAHHLALTNSANTTINRIQLTFEEAILYLQKKNLMIKTEARGWALVQYKGHNLGWIKVLGNRTNNYYPKEWRIRKERP